MEMDIRKLCFHCFQEKANPAGVCPHCGYDPASQAQYPLALPAGSVLAGRYIVGRVLGQGGFGITYVALDVQQKICVAVKEYMPETMATRQTGTLQVTAFSGGQAENFSYGKDQFLEEARTLAKFAGVNGIVSVHTYFEENGTAYFAMEYVEGTSFKSFIKQNGGKVSWQVARSVLIPVMDALGEVHQAGIIHRDVTPDNIYVNREGAVKLLDFGAARYSIGDRSRSLDVVLKAGYAPKEQYVRRGRQGPFTDVYSVAASFYASMTGYLPPESLERMEDDNIVPPSNRGVSLPAAAEDAILKGLEVRAEDRFQSMAVFKEALMAADPSPLLPIFPGARPPMEAAAHPVRRQISFTPAAAPVPPVQQPTPQPAPQPMPQITVQAPAQQPAAVVQTPGANVSVSYVNMQGAPVQQAPMQQVPVQPAPVQQAPVQPTPVQPAPVQPAPVMQTPVSQTPVSQTPVSGGAPAPVGPAAYTPPAKKSNTGLFVGIGVAGGVLLLLLVALVAVLFVGGGKNNVPTSSSSYGGYSETSSVYSSYTSSAESSSTVSESKEESIEYSNGDTYVGSVVDGEPNGQGVYTWVIGSTFEGNFEDGLPSGEGTFTYVDGTTKTSTEWVFVFEDSYSYTGGDYQGQTACYYTGLCIGNEAYGYGRFEYVEDDPYCPGWVYDGEMNDDDANGFGTLEFPYGGTYVGHITAGYPDGQGTYNYVDGRSVTNSGWMWLDGVSASYYSGSAAEASERFEETMQYYGMVCSEMLQGYGQYIFNDGGIFWGESKDNCISGYGCYTFVDGEELEGFSWSEEMNASGHSGMLYNGDYAGYGLFTWDDDTEWYSGEFNDGYRNGYGVYHWADGDEFNGYWVDGDRNGYGMLVYGDSGTIYMGDWMDDYAHGYGVMTWVEGDKYEGGYYMGKRHGEGTYTWADGDYYTGEWVEGERTGYGKYVYSDGTVQEGQWENGTFLG